jgi:PKD repeat protein
VVRLDVSVDELGSRDAIAGLSPVSIDTRGSTGSQLTYSVDFGDGSPPATEPLARHVYDTPGTFSITCVVRDSAGQTATATRQIVVKTVTGRWFHAGYLPRARRFELRSLTISSHDGPLVRGFFGLTGTPDRPFTGRLASPRTIHIALDDQTAQLEGLVPSVVDEEDGTFTLLMRGGTVDGERLIFRRVLGEPTGPPPDAVLKILFDSFGAARPIQGLSPVHFDGSGSRGEQLSYVIEFGDGQFASDPTATHVIETSGTTTTRLTIVDRFGRTDREERTFHSDSMLNFTSAWVFNVGREPWRGFYFSTRDGLSLTGTFSKRDQGDPRLVSSPFVATLSGERDIRIALTDSGLELRGYIQLTADPWGGQIVLVPVGAQDLAVLTFFLVGWL